MAANRHSFGVVGSSCAELFRQRRFSPLNESILL